MLGPASRRPLRLFLSTLCSTARLDALRPGGAQFRRTFLAWQWTRQQVECSIRIKPGRENLPKTVVLRGGHGSV